MAVQNFGLRLTAESDGQSKIDAFNAALEKLTTTNDRFGKSAEAAGNKATSSFADIKARIADPLGAVGEKFESVIESGGRFALVAGGAAVAAGVLGSAALKLVSAQGQAAEAMFNLAARTGLTVNQVDKLQAMAAIAGVNLESLEGAGRILSQTLDDTGAAGDKAFRALNKLGVQTVTVTGDQRDLGAVTLEVIERLSRVQNVAERTALANQILGRSAKEIQPLIAQYQELDKVVEEMGFGTREGLLKALAEADDKMDQLGLKWELLKGKLAQPVAAVVNLLLSSTGQVGGNQQPGFGSSLASVNTGAGGPGRGAIDRLGVGGAGSILASAEAERAAMAGRAEQFRRAFGATEEGRLAALTEERDAARRAALQGVKGAQERFFSAEARLKALRNPPKAIAELSLAELRKGEGRPTPTLFRARDLEAQIVGQPVEGVGDGSAEYGRGLLERLKAASEQRIQAAKSLLDYQTRIVELTAGPGGELAAIQRIYELRVAAAQTTEEAQTAERERVISILELQRRQRDELRASAGSIFDAITRGRGGITDYLKGLLLTQGRTVFQNVAEIAFGGRGGKLSLPGTTGANGQPTLLGRVLAGTPFGADPSAGLQMTAAQIQLQAAQLQAGAAASGAAGSIGGAIGGLSTVTSGGRPGINPAGFGPEGAAFFGLKSTSTLSRAVGFGGAIAGGVIGTSAGIRQGGVQGGLTAGSALAGTAASLLALSGVSGPAAPILAGLAAAAGVASLILGDPKKRRAAALDNTIAGARFDDVSGADYGAFAVGGGSVDFDRRGSMRVFVKQEVNINAMDARSIIDRRDDIAEAVRLKLGETSALPDAMRAALMPA